MARVRRRARPCGAWGSAGLTDGWTGSGPLREAKGKARPSGASGGTGGRAPGKEEIGPREKGDWVPREREGRAPGGRGDPAPGERRSDPGQRADRAPGEGRPDRRLH